MILFNNSSSSIILLWVWMRKSITDRNEQILSCSTFFGKLNSIFDNFSLFKLSCATPCESFCISILNLSNRCFTNRTLVAFFFGIKPIILSGKQAFIFKIAVSAMFAAIVIHKVSSCYNLLWFNPASE